MGCQRTHSETPSIHNVHSIMGRRNKHLKNLNFPCYKEFGCTFSSDSQKGLSLHQKRCNAVNEKIAAAAAAIKSSQASNVSRPNLPLTELPSKRFRDNSTAQSRNKRPRHEQEVEVCEQENARASTSRSETRNPRSGLMDDDMSSRPASPIGGWQDPSDMDWMAVSCKMYAYRFTINMHFQDNHDGGISPQQVAGDSEIPYDPTADVSAIQPVTEVNKEPVPELVLGRGCRRKPGLPRRYRDEPPAAPASVPRTRVAQPLPQPSSESTTIHSNRFQLAWIVSDRRRWRTSGHNNRSPPLILAVHSQLLRGVGYAHGTW